MVSDFEELLGLGGYGLSLANIDIGIGIANDHCGLIYMNKLLAALIIMSPAAVFSAISAKSTPVELSSNDIVMLSAMISNFDILDDPQGINIVIRNANGQGRSQILTSAVEEFEEYSKYEFYNPHQKNHTLDLFIFTKLKPVLLDDRDLNGSVDDISDLRFDLHVLTDTVSKKTIKSKVVVYYKDSVVAKGGVETNLPIKISNDLSKQIKNGKLQEIKITQNLMDSYKRSMDIEVKYVQSNKLLKQKLTLNLQNVKQTPIHEEIIEEEVEEDLDQSLDETTEENLNQNLEQKIENKGLEKR